MEGCQHILQTQQTKTVCKGVIVTLAVVFNRFDHENINHLEFISLYVTKFVVITPFEIVCTRPIKLNLANKTNQNKKWSQILLIFANLPIERKCGLSYVWRNFCFFRCIHKMSSCSCRWRFPASGIEWESLWCRISNSTHHPISQKPDIL